MFKKRASSALDYSLLAVIVVTALILMGGYIKRGLMKKYKEAGDAYGDGRQYDRGGPRIENSVCRNTGGAITDCCCPRHTLGTCVIDGVSYSTAERYNQPSPCSVQLKCPDKYICCGRSSNPIRCPKENGCNFIPQLGTTVCGP